MSADGLHDRARALGQRLGDRGLEASRTVVVQQPQQGCRGRAEVEPALGEGEEHGATGRHGVAQAIEAAMLACGAFLLLELPDVRGVFDLLALGEAPGVACNLLGPVKDPYALE